MPCWDRIETFSETQVKDLVVWLAENPPGAGRDQVTQMAFFRWAQINPRAAVAGLQAQPELTATCEAGHAVLCAWAKLDPAAATQWIEAPGNEKLRRNFEEETAYRRKREEARLAGKSGGKETRDDR